MYDAERGIFELRRGRALVLTGPETRPGGEAVERLVAAAEGLQGGTLTWLRAASGGGVHVVVTGHRGVALGLVSPVGIHGNGATPPGAIAVELAPGSTPEDVLRLCCAPAPPPLLAARARPATGVERSALMLARTGHLLPAVLSAPLARPRPRLVSERLSEGSVLAIRADRLDSPGEDGVARVSEAPVPIRDAEDARFVMFREERGLLEHVAILVGDRNRWPDPVPVRLHSACLTGDLFGSLKCDCGEQLRGSLRHFRESGGGVLLYLAHEGRGIGLANKLRAYALQEDGLDTVDADCALGFGPDERTYESALYMLRDLGVRRVALLTNNPEKLRAVQLGGVQVLQRRPIHGTLNRYNLPYVKAKVQRAGHWLSEMLSGAPGTGG